jgi:hypothetical protein
MVVERDLAASAVPSIDGDWRFAIAYNAALQCAAAALKAAGYELAKGAGSHMRTIESLRLTLGDDGTVVNVLQTYRRKRVEGIYETAGIATETEVKQIRTLAVELRDDLIAWLHDNHPQLIKPQQQKPKRKN